MLSIASYIDHTALKPTTTSSDIEKLCAEALEYNFIAVCVPPYFVPLAKALVKSKVKVATVIGFPNGYNTINSKKQEIEEAISNGADELDIIHNLSALKSDDWQTLEREITLSTRLTHNYNRIIKVIVESGTLTDDELIKCCDLYKRIGIDYMKTSTGFAQQGATLHAVELMRKHLPRTINIKAAGGIRSFAFAQELINAGATRIGCSASLQILKESVDL